MHSAKNSPIILKVTHVFYKVMHVFYKVIYAFYKLPNAIIYANAIY